MAIAQKAFVELGNVRLAATHGIVWKLQTGTQPYSTVMSVHTTDWKQALQKKLGKPIDLVIRDGRGVKIKVRALTIMHVVASARPHLTSFVVADRRWRWAYKFVSRDYNIAKKTGDRTAHNREDLPTGDFSVDKYDYRPYSLNNGERWTAEAAVVDMMRQVEPSRRPDRKDWFKFDSFIIESFPIKKQKGKGRGDGEFAIQNIIVRDQADVALARLLAYVPGAEVYIDINGIARVFDGADLRRAESHLKSLGTLTWDGQKPEMIDRKKIRPKEVKVYYTREVEILLAYSDDFSGTTSTDPSHLEPYIDNVIPTVDRKTTVTEYDPVLKKTTTKVDVPQGTYVTMRAWLKAMDLRKKGGSMAWTWDTIRTHWLTGDLEGRLAGAGSRGTLDEDPEADNTARVLALRQHFRQSFRINARYTERTRDMQAVCVAILDPVTGARAPAMIWGQACIIPTKKGELMASREDPERGGVWRNIDNTATGLGATEHTVFLTPSPARVVIIDRDLGIFRLEWVLSPYGTDAQIVPCNVVDAGNKMIVPSRNITLQDEKPVGPGMVVEGGTNGIFLRNTMDFKVLITVVPAAPNNKNQYHVEDVKANNIRKIFRKEFGIKDGEGPTLEIFVPPTEATARFAWDIDSIATETVGRLFGLDSEDSATAGLVDDPETEDVDESKMLGFEMTNKKELRSHALSVAAEMIAHFSDSIQGGVATALSPSGLWLRGNMSGASIHVGSFPSAKVHTEHEFPGQQKPISRLAMMPEATRHLILGILPFGQGDK